MDLSRPSQQDPHRSPTQPLHVTPPYRTKATLPRGHRLGLCSTRVSPKPHYERGDESFLVPVTKFFRPSLHLYVLLIPSKFHIVPITSSLPPTILTTTQSFTTSNTKIQ
ncbi:hypothetical protein E2C01_014166 [Portunus trituberculatus]|uniref:Uncharacterized protein n=1 Tax=Portunus trituberculatus TaxID=210409 RepID=A0A5B7DJE2_PORTR|nr:hypothetical protein [Portunus trituberculatus]